MTTETTATTEADAALEAAIAHAAEYEAPADGVAWGEHIIRFKDLTALLARARRADELAAEVVRLRKALRDIEEDSDDPGARECAKDALECQP